MTKLTFIEAANGKRLGKTFKKKSTESYPKVKSLNSFEYEPTTISERFDLICEHAAKGHAMLRGDFTKLLLKESRKGLCNTTLPNATFILDVDKLKLDNYTPTPGKLKSHHVEQICERVVGMLPIEMQNSSYIGHASASMGRSASTHISVHIEFVLDSPIAPDMLKDFTSHLNYACEDISKNLTLSDTTTSVKSILDPCVADNSHIIFIAPPVFIGTDDPFESPEQRFCLVEKQHATLNLTGLMSTLEEKGMAAIKNKHMDALRKLAGLKAYRPKKKDYTTKEGKVRVVINPDPFELKVCEITEEFARFNMGASNSYKYWCHLTSPHIIHCWNGDDSFEHQKADPEGYEDFIANYKTNIDKVTHETALVFRDIRTDKHYHMLYDTKLDALLPGLKDDLFLYGIKLDHIENWLSEYGQPMPEPIPSLHYVYDPSETLTVRNEVNGLVNKYMAPPHIKKIKNIDPEFKGITYDPDSTENMGGTLLKQLCPNAYKIMWHMTGSREREFEHFINWLAAAIDKKEPLQTVWIFSGTQGTGKGLFFDHILTPMIGKANVDRKGLSALEDTFNSFLSNKLFVGIDEFHISDSKQDKKTFDYIKQITGGNRVDVRGMYKESINVQMFTNFMFFSNHTDVCRLEDGDRRHNIGFPQPLKIQTAYPELFLNSVDLVELLATEIADLFAFMYHFDYDMHAARTCIDNEAKRNMRIAGMGTHQKFCFALREGDLDYFVENINALTHVPPFLLIIKQTAEKLLTKWIDDSINALPSDVSISEAHAMYSLLNADSSSTTQKFSAMLTRNDVPTIRKRKDGKRANFIETRFTFNEYEPSDFLDNVPDAIPAGKRVTNIASIPEVPAYIPNF